MFMESEVPISNLEDLRTKRTFLKEFLEATGILLWILKENYLFLSEYHKTENEVEFKDLTCKTLEKIKRGRNYLQVMDNFDKRLEVYMALIKTNSSYIDVKTKEVAELNSSNDLQQSVSKYQDLQLDLQQNIYAFEYIKSHQKDLFTSITCSEIEESSRNLQIRFQEVKDDIEMKLSNVFNLPKQCMALEKELVHLKTWLTSANSRVTSISKSMKQNKNKLGTLVKNLKELSEIEAEFTKQSKLYNWIEHTFDQNTLDFYNLRSKYSINEICTKWNELEKSVGETRDSLIVKISEKKREEIESFLQNLVKSAEKNLEDISIESSKDLQELQFKMLSWNSSLEAVRTLVDDQKWNLEENKTSKESDKVDVRESFDSLKIQQLHLRVKHLLEKINLSILQYEDYERRFIELTDVLNQMQCTLKNILQKLPATEYTDAFKYALFVKKLQKELEANKKIEEFKLLGQEIQETTKNESLKTNVSEKNHIVDELTSTLHHLLHDALGKTQERSKLLEAFKNACDSCFSFMNEKDLEYNTSSKKIANVEHLSATITNLEHILHDFEINEELLNKVIKSGEVLLKEGQNIPSEIANQTNLHNSRWKELKIKFSSVHREYVNLHMIWTEFLGSYKEINSLTTKAHEEIMLSSLGCCDIKNVKGAAKMIFDCKNQLQSLTKRASILEESSALHCLSKATIQDSVNCLNSLIGSVEKLIEFSEETLQPIIQETENKTLTLDQAGIFLNKINSEQFKEALPLHKEDIKTSLHSMEELLLEGVPHYASAQCIRRNLLLEELQEFSLIKATSHTLKKLKEVLSRTAMYYLNLHKIHSSSNPVLQNLYLLQKFIASFKCLSEKRPSCFSEVAYLYVELQMMGIQMQACQATIDCIIQNIYKNTTSEDLVLEFARGLQLKWIRLEKSYQLRVQKTRTALSSWQNFLFFLHLLKAKKHNIKKYLLSHPRVYKLHEIQSNSLTIQKFLDEQEGLLSLTASMENAFEEILFENAAEKDILKQEIENIKQDLDCQRNILLGSLSGLKELSEKSDECRKYLNMVKENMLSVQSFLNSPASQLPLSESHQDYEENCKKMRISSDLLCKTKKIYTGIQEKACILDIHEEIFGYQELIKALDVELQKPKSNRSGLDKKMQFEDTHKQLETLGEAVITKVQKKYYETPEKILEKMHLDNEKDTNNCNDLLQQVIILGENLSENEVETEYVSKRISAAKDIVSSLSSERKKRESNITRIIIEKDKATMIQKNLTKLLITSEEFLYSPIQFNEVSLKEADVVIQQVQTIQDNIAKCEEDINTLSDLTEKLVSESDAFSCYNERHLFQYLSLSIIRRWYSIKTLSFERFSFVTEVRSMWEDILSLLDKLNEFLVSKESIAAEIDYSEGDHPRNVYLNGIKVFETINHSFQENVHLLHAVNASYHQIGRKEIDVDNFLQAKVVELNERWYALYRKVTMTITTITNVLQLWADYEQLHQHLHLFLVESHLKLTDSEQSEKFSEKDWNTLMNDFMLHEDVLKRFYSSANNLKYKSKCSQTEIDNQVEEMKRYWALVYECLLTYKNNFHEMTETIQKNQSLDLEKTSQYFSGQEIESIQKVSIQSGSEYVQDSSEMSVLDGSTKNQLNPTCDISSSEEEKKITTITSTGKTKESLMTQIKKDEIVMKPTSDKQTTMLNLPEKDSIPSDLIDIGKEHQELLKDICAALNEAENRIDSLEIVLSEPTPSGTDETLPNYARLLAACRSSIDVIQHLNNLLFENYPLESKQAVETTNVQLRTEAILKRWEIIESSTINKELKTVENSKKWKRFSKDLHDMEKWLMVTIQNQPASFTSDADMEEFIKLLQRHELLVSEISQRKQIIITLNSDGQRFISSSQNTESITNINAKLKSINDHWSRLCSLTLEWQNMLQAEFLQSSEFHNTICEMELWLEEAGEKIQYAVPRENESISLHEQHTELFALKQQLSSCSLRVKTLLEISRKLFSDENFESSAYKMDGVLEVQTKLSHILDHSHSLLQECSVALSSLSKILLTTQVHQDPDDMSRSNTTERNQPTRLKRCCNFLLRVAKASIPIQAVLLLILGAAILLPKDEEELSCRLSNNFASSLNPMLRYPGGPPPV